MSEIARVAILIHEHEREPLDPRYIAGALAEAWRDMGLEVEIVRGLGRPVEADLWLPHVDLTVVPPDYRRHLDACPRVVNRAVVDISKRHVSQQLVRPGDGYRGPVIVKSNANYGGRPERRLLHGDRPPRWRRLRERVGRLRTGLGLGFDAALPLDPRDYPIFDSVDALSPRVFSNPEVVVERFVPERDGELYVLRSFAFGGDAAYNVRMTSARPIVKAGDVIDRAEVPVPEQLHAVRARLGLDYGKLDYVCVDGRVHLLDVNRTPTFGRVGEDGYDERQKAIAARFALGLIERLGKQPEGT